MGFVSWQKWLVSSGFCWPHLLNVHVQSMDFAAASTDDADQISAGKHEYSQDSHSVALMDFCFWDFFMDHLWSSIFWSVIQKIRSQEDSSSQLKNADDQIIQYLLTYNFYRLETLKCWHTIMIMSSDILDIFKSCFHWGACKLAKPMQLGFVLGPDGISVDLKLEWFSEVWDMQKERRAKNCFEDLTSQLQEEVKLAPCHDSD